MSDYLGRLPSTPTDVSYTQEDLLNANRDVEFVNRNIKQAEVDRFDEDTVLRKKLSTRFTIIISAWLLSVILILCFNDIKLCLSDNVLITLLTTTTVNVLGMMYIILRNLFPEVK